MTPRRGRAARRALVGFVAVVAAAVGLAWPAQATMTATYTVFTWNVAGWAMHRGSMTDGLVPTISRSVQSVRPTWWRSTRCARASTGRWWRACEPRAGPRTPPTSRGSSRTAPTDCGGQAFGVAIFSTAPLGAANRFVLSPDGSSEGRRLLCAPLASRVHLRFCTSHVTPETTVIDGQPVNQTQLNEVHSRLESFDAAGDTVLIAGDLNAQPHDGASTRGTPRPSPRPTTRPTPVPTESSTTPTRGVPVTARRRRPAPRGGRCGQSAKIDLIFVRANRIVGSYSADSLVIPSCGAIPCSDHRTLFGTVRVSVG